MRKLDPKVRMILVRQFSRGVTLIEMVIVVVVLAILAGLVIPQYGNVSEDASQAAVNGIAGAAASVAANRAAACKGKLGDCPSGTEYLGCVDANFQAAMDTGGATFLGPTAVCVVTYKGKTATFKSY